MFLHEMDLDLTCPEICFQAESPEDCYRVWQNLYSQSNSAEESGIVNSD